MSATTATAADVAELGACLEAAGIVTPPAALEPLATFALLLEKWNRVYNLTGIRARGDLLERHIVESLALAPLLSGDRVADVGTGAGLPGLPLAIACPERHFTLIESRRKRVNFMRHVTAQLALTNVAVAHSRAEDLSSPEPFATVLARAVAPPAQLLKIIRPLTTSGSVLVLLTSAEIGREVTALAHDFVVRHLPPDVGTGLRSSIVVLERMDGGASVVGEPGNSDG